MFEVKFDTTSFDKKVANYVSSITRLSKKSLLDIGNEILRLSEKEVPHDKGLLQSSNVAVQGNDEVVVGYNKKYAARLHEHPEYNFQKGRKGKYLEDPIVNNIKLFRGIIGKALDIVK